MPIIVIGMNICGKCSEKATEQPQPTPSNAPTSEPTINSEQGDTKNNGGSEKNNMPRKTTTHTDVVTASPATPVRSSTSPPSQISNPIPKKWNGDQSRFDAVKKSIKALPNVPSAGAISTAKQFIEAGAAANWIDWMNNTGLVVKQADKVVLVNASNTGISFGGSTINGAIKNFVTKVHTQTSWHDLELPDGTKGPTSIKPGEYAISTAGTWSIYHACGVSAGDIRKGNIESIEQAQEIMTTMIFNMLTKAYSSGMKTIVLCAISTVAFAGAGTTADGSLFTKDQFLRAMYIGMYSGIEKFKSANTASQLSLILNGWDIDVVI